MKKQFVNYESALALKELGCNDFKMFGWYINEDASEFEKSLHTIDDRMFYFNVMYCFKAPLWQQVIDWFRTNHGIIINIMRTIETTDGYRYMYLIEEWDSDDEIVYDSNAYFKTYEEAREAAILEAIKTIKSEPK